MKKLLLLCAACLILFASCGQIEENKRLKEENRLLREKDSIENVKKQEEEAMRIAEQNRIAKIRSNEVNNPASFIKANAQLGVKETHLFSDDEYLLKADIVSSAKYHNYTNVVIKLSYYSKYDVLLKTENIVYTGVANSTKTAFSKRVYPPRDYNRFTMEILRAEAIEK